jgi:tetratricopeptide (TPR) repeat protein
MNFVRASSVGAIAFALAITHLIACKRAGVPAATSAPAPEAPSNRTGPPPTEEECLKLAREIEAAAVAGDAAEYARLVGFDSMAKNGVDRLGLPPSERSGVYGIIDSSGGGLFVARGLVGDAKLGHTYRFVHLHRVDGDLRALFRLCNIRTDLWNYHDFQFVRRPDGSIAVADILYLSSGDTVSDMAHRTVLMLVPPDKRHLITLNLPVDEALLNETKTLGTLIRSVKEGNGENGVRAYGELSPELRREKYSCVLRVLAAQNAGEKEHAEAIENLRKFHPNDIATDFLSIDYFTRTRQHDQALAAIDRTDAILGGDPAMDVKRGLAHLSAGSFEKARERLKRAIDREPTFEPAYWAMATLTAKEKKFGETAKWLKRYQERLTFEIGDLSTHPDYAEFVKSPQYKEWLKWQKEHAGKRNE